MKGEREMFRKIYAKDEIRLDLMTEELPNQDILYWEGYPDSTTY
jgi:hypothetical protein